MSKYTFNSHVNIHYGVESKKSRLDCDKCDSIGKKKGVDGHCHCSIADISEKMVVNCKSAYKKLDTDEETEKKITEKSSDVEEKLSSMRKDRLDTLAGKLVQRRTFFNLSHMDKIYADKNKSKKIKTKSVTVPDPVSNGEGKSSKKRVKSVSGNPVAKKRKK